MNLETKKPRGRPRNRWQDEVREGGRIVDGERWQEKVYNREEWKRLLRTAWNHCSLHMAMELSIIVNGLFDHEAQLITMNDIWGCCGVL
jgi:hypothetical protein